MDINHILHLINHGILAVDTEGEIIYINSYASRLFGIETAKKVNRAEQNNDAINHFIQKCIQPSKVNRGNFENRNTVVFYHTFPIRQENRATGTLCYLHELEKTDMPDHVYGYPNDIIKLFNDIFEYSIDGIVLLDKDGNCIAINESLCQLVGTTKEMLLGKNVSNGLSDGLWDYSTALDVYKKKRKVSHVEYLPKTKKQILVTGIPVFDDDGEISNVIMNERDITHLNDLRNEVEQSRRLREKYENQIAGINISEFENTDIVVQSKEMVEVFKAAQRCAQMEVSNILITGESGTGKGLLANYIYNSSRRKDKPFIQINCAALPHTLLEAELFGYEEGAFTGAARGGKIGLFELAENGTLFLDEIGDLPLSTQAKLLKYLDDHEIMHLGGTKSIKIDCVVIAATNKNLIHLIEAGGFRNDLFHRLNAFSIKIPPLRERKDDIIGLTDLFLRNFNRKYRVKKRCSPSMLKRLCTNQYPGNVRQLKNTIHNAVVMSEHDCIDQLLSIGLVDANDAHVTSSDLSYGEKSTLKSRIQALEKAILKEAQKKCRTTREMAAYVGASHTTLVRKMKKYGFS